MKSDAFLTESAEIHSFKITQKINCCRRAELGQFLTPAHIARLISSQFSKFSGNIRLLDPGAGIGILTAAFVERVLEHPAQVKSCSLTAYEIEPAFFDPLKQTLSECCDTLENAGIKSEFHIHGENFITSEETVGINQSLFSKSEQTFTHVILNPPYRKIHNQSLERRHLSYIGIETVNLYSAFLWLSMLYLSDGGELAAITPRSFCNGTYFRPFRKAFLNDMTIDRIHIFESRTYAFSKDDVLQENIIFHAVKQKKTLEIITITQSEGKMSDESETIKTVPYQNVIKNSDRQKFIHIVTDDIEDSFRKQMELFPCTLDELGLRVSTGAVVDFRLKTFLRDTAGAYNVPLLYPEAIREGKISWPPAVPRKAIAIEHNSTTEKWMNPSGWYVLTRRFSAKEEKKRVVAAVCPPLHFPVIGIENHLNFYHADGKGMDADIAKGLTVFLNSTLFDNYFRQFSGHTQVNATDLRKILYPCKEDLAALGRKTDDITGWDQIQVDKLVQETLKIMKETIRAFEAAKRIKEALLILKDISAPRSQQNDRSALCLLSLADIGPETPWAQAQAPLRGITEMMDWFRDHYGKQYAPNTRETVRRQTMHQFVQMGLVVENPDQPDRPVNSPKWCYQLHENALKMLRSYGSVLWESELKEYTVSAANLLHGRKRNLAMIPICLPDGKNIRLSAGGQNKLIKDILEIFCPRFTPGGTVLYIGDAGEKFVVNETAKMKDLGIEIDPHGKMPDLIIYHEKENWIVLIEAVTSHGPVNIKRRNELMRIFKPCKKGLVFVTAFPDRKEMTRYLAEISWETEVWIADQPDHMIHFNGERFLGPYE